MKYEVKERVELSAKETALIIVDMQNDFAHERGSLFVPDAPKTIKPIKSLIEKFREKNSTIIYTQDWHMEDDPEFKIWGVHAVAGTWGAEIVDELRPTDRDITVKKLRYDAFYGTSLDHILRVKGIKSLMITGTVANICVLHTAGSAALRWYNVIVPMDCISALTEDDYQFTLRQVDFLYKGTIVRSQENIVLL
ncbi:MAG: isochorismatase family cysteine hydrolase [candidate division WOR-3 bacterium]